MAEPIITGTGGLPQKEFSNHSSCLLMTFSVAKRDEIARLMNILELDFEQKNFLPPREIFPYASHQGRARLTYHA